MMRFTKIVGRAIFFIGMTMTIVPACKKDAPSQICEDPCACDATYSCDEGCQCDPECGGCLPACSSNCVCDTTYGCDSECDCDPECGACLAANGNTTCVPDCTGRDCGPDPDCQTSCGTCQTGTCNASGVCEQTQPKSGAAGPCLVDDDCGEVVSYGGTGSSPERTVVPQVCRSETQYGFPGGLCTMLNCVYNVRRDPCPDGTECFMVNGESVCLTQCDDPSGCREGWACTECQTNQYCEQWGLCKQGCDANSCSTGYSCGQDGVCHGDPGCRGHTKLNDPRDGTSYGLVEFGSLCWFGRNLRYLPSGSSYWRCYDLEANDCVTDGRLFAASTSDFCPAGWHTASDGEWQLLEQSLGLSATQSAQTGWRGTTQGAQLRQTTSGGFAALMAGYGLEFAGFFERGEAAYFWTSTHTNDTWWYRNVRRDRDDIYRDSISVAGQMRWYSIRCVLDY
jgi:uncharacterized protein (TIGR02145 family)